MAVEDAQARLQRMHETSADDPVSVAREEARRRDSDAGGGAADPLD